MKPVPVGVLFVSVLALSMMARPSYSDVDFDSLYSDKVFYVTTTKVSGNINGATAGEQRQLVDSICEQDMPYYLQPGTATAIINLEQGSFLSTPYSEGLAQIEQGFSAIRDQRLETTRNLGTEGYFWYAPNNTALPRFLGMEESYLLNGETEGSGFRAGDKPVRYWTGIDVDYENARACIGKDFIDIGPRFSSSAYNNTGSSDPSVFGATVGTGFIISPYFTWLIDGIASCNETLPLLCEARSRGPTPLDQAELQPNGDVIVTFDFPTNGLSKGVFPCTELVQFGGVSGQNRSVASLDKCRFTDSKTLVITFKRLTANWDINTNYLTFVTTQLGPFIGGGRMAIAGLMDITGVVPAMALESVSIRPVCVSDYLTLSLPIKHAQCATTLTGKWSGDFDYGRPYQYSKVYISPCPDPSPPWTQQEENCYRELTPLELTTKTVHLNTTLWDAASYSYYSIEVYVKSWLVDAGENSCEEGQASSQIAVYTTQEIYADLVMPNDFGSIYISQPFTFTPPAFTLDPKCLPLGVSMANVSFEYIWLVGVEINTRRLLSSDGLEGAPHSGLSKTTKARGGRVLQEVLVPGPTFNSTKRVLVIPPYSLPSGPRGFQEGINYRVGLVLVLNLVNDSIPIFNGVDQGFRAGSRLTVTSTPLVYDVRATVSLQNSVTIDASRTCDPDIARGRCDAIRKFVPTPASEFRGVYFSQPITCERFYFNGEVTTYRPCDPGLDSVGGTSKPTVSPTNMPTVSPNYEDVPPTPQPTANLNGIATFANLVPGIYRFIQPMTSVLGADLVVFDDENRNENSCTGNYVPDPFAMECSTSAGVILEIKPLIPNCIPPIVSVEPLPQAKVTIFPNSSAVVRSTVVYGGVQATNGLLWEVKDPQTGTFYPIGPTVPSSVFKAPGIATPLTRPNLVLPSNVLTPGTTYTLRLTANGLGSGCPGSVAIREFISFTVNAPPAGGSASVSPQSGRSFTDEFTLSCLNWLDDDLPLQYSFSLRRAGSENEATISNFQTASSVVTKLASPRRTGNFIVCNARDAFNARSSSVSSEVLLDPLYNAQQGTGNLPNPQQFLDSLSNQDADAKLRALSALALSALGTRQGDVNSTDEAFLTGWRKDVATATIDAVLQTRETTAGNNDVGQIALQVNALLAGVSAESDLGEAILGDASQLVKDLLVEAQNALTTAALEKGVTAPTLIPSGFSGSLLDLLSELSKGIQAGANALGLRRRLNAFDPRALQADPSEAAYKRSVENLRGSLNQLIGSLMQGYTPGAPVQIAQGVQIEMVVARESRDLVGGSEGVTTLTLGDISVTLPPNVLAPQFIKNNVAVESVDVALVRFKFNIRELVTAAQQPDGFNSSNVTVSGVKDENFEVREITTLLFLSSTDPTVLLDPSDLTIPINITMKLPDDYELPANTTGLELVCGAWDTSVKGWSNFGAVATQFDPVTRTVVCSSTHASDFAAWNAFVKNIGGGPVGIIVIVAIIVVGIMLPLVLLTYFAAMFWAKVRDKRDADGVHVGALLLLTKNKLRLRARQRRFFKMLRENAQSPQPLVVDEARARQLKADREVVMQKLRDEQKSWAERWLPGVVLRWFRAFYYDHSFVGVFTRFDPYYDRMQRVTVVCSVVCGNLFIASFFFELKTAQDITVGFMIGVVVLASLVVAIPIKIIVRVLFRSTEALTGSTMDRVAQIYRISHIYQDILPVYASAAEQADIEMILAFREYYLAKAGLQQATSMLEEAQRRIKGETWWDKFLIRVGLRQRLNDETMSKMAKSVSQRIRLDEPKSMDVSELRMSVEKAQGIVRTASQDLKEKCRVAKAEWEKVPVRRNARVETLRKQQSSIMRFAALLYDEADSGPPRERTKRLHAGFLVVAWFIVLGYLIGCLAFTSYWVLAYTSIRTGTQDVVQTDANQVILAWLLAAGAGIIIGLFVAEPFLQFVRFGLMPWCLHRFGNGIVPANESPLLDDEESDGAEDGDQEAGKGKLVAHATGGEEGRDKDMLAASFYNKVKSKKKGETHAETAGIAVFDLAAEVVEALA